MTDTQLVRIAERIDRHNQAIWGLMWQIGESDLPKREELIEWLGVNGFDNLSWATHCIREYLRHPEEWETGPWGIRRCWREESENEGPKDA